MSVKILLCLSGNQLCEYIYIYIYIYIYTYIINLYIYTTCDFIQDVLPNEICEILKKNITHKNNFMILKKWD